MVHSLFQYDGPWVDLVYRLKYNQEKHLALKIISESIIKDGFEKVILVPIPLTLGRYRERGYNQAKEIALALQKKLGTECEILDLLKRNRFSRSQTSLNKGQRKKNLESTFGVHKRVFFKNRSKLQSHKIIIVDDVFTTGATLLSANDLLNEWGIRNIEGFVLARASLKSEMPKDLLSLAIFGPDYGFVTRNNNGQN